MKEKKSLFEYRDRNPNFLVTVLVFSLRILLVVILLAGLALGGAVFGIAKGYIGTAPTLNLALLDAQDKTSFLYDTEGNIITDYKGTENRIMINIALMPKNLQHAFVAVEDIRFYSHNGIDLKRIAGSFLSNLVSGGQQGGSTITQQLIKNTILTSEQSYKRKIQEAYLALQLENRYTKDQILEYYLNTIYLGENYYGVQVASQGYFGKNPSELSLRECAMLAGMTTNPYYYNPRRNFYTRTSETTDYTSITNDRTDYVLNCMLKGEFITQEEYESALNPATANVLRTDPSEGAGMYAHAHYVEYAVKEIVDVFLNLRGLENTSENRYKMENELRTGGYSVTLAMDTSIQTIVEETLETWKKYPNLSDPSDKIYRTKNSDGTYNEVIQPQTAVVVLDYRTGELKAVVGSRTRPTVRKSMNRATDMKMPVGSAIKPIAVYAPALELGYSPASVVYNIPVPIAGWRASDGTDSWPRNYGGGDYVGPETLRNSMRRSHNVSAAQTLLNLVGVERSVDFLHRMGVPDTNIDATPYGLSLGSSGITPLQLASAFGTLGNGGIYLKPISILGISDSAGNVIYDAHANQESRQVFRAATAWMTVDMMKTVVSNGTATGAKLKGQTVAGKTGTNSDERGVTFCGMTGYYVSSIWVGHDNYKPLSSKTTAGNGAVPIWKEYMTKIHQNLPNKDIMDVDPSALGLVKVTTCAVSGQLATDACKSDAMGYGTVTDYWYEPTVPTVYCQMHQTMNICAESGMLATEYCPNVISKGVTVIPNGHPLSGFVNDPQYGPVVSQYLGTAAGLGYCPYHSEQSWIGEYNADGELVQQARNLLQEAYNFLMSTSPEDQRYGNVLNAVSMLEGLIQQNPTADQVNAAIATLYAAMQGYGY